MATTATSTTIAGIGRWTNTAFGRSSTGANRRTTRPGAQGNAHAANAGADWQREAQNLLASAQKANAERSGAAVSHRVSELSHFLTLQLAICEERRLLFLFFE